MIVVINNNDSMPPEGQKYTYWHVIFLVLESSETAKCLAGAGHGHVIVIVYECRLFLWNEGSIIHAKNINTLLAEVFSISNVAFNIFALPASQC